MLAITDIYRHEEEEETFIVHTRTDVDFHWDSLKGSHSIHTLTFYMHGELVHSDVYADDRHNWYRSLKPIKGAFTLFLDHIEEQQSLNAKAFANWPSTTLGAKRVAFWNDAALLARGFDCFVLDNVDRYHVNINGTQYEGKALWAGNWEEADTIL